MIVRALDSNGDWTFGKGLNDYKSANAAVAQLIQTRLNSFTGDCFFDQGAGIDWFTLLGGKDQLTLMLSISSVILNTANVLSLNQIFVNLSSAREFSAGYSVTSTYSTITDQIDISI